MLPAMSSRPDRIPHIVITVAAPAMQSDPEMQVRRNTLYVEGVRRAGGEPVLLDAMAGAAARAQALAMMDGLLLSGGGDIDPAHYGVADAGSTEVERDRDALEAEAFATAEARSVPVFGICRGIQAMNVFAGGTLLQHVDDHAGPGLGQGPAHTHALRIEPGTRLAGIVGDDLDGAPVNTFHHQAVRVADLAPGFVASAWADSPVGPIVEGLEAPGDRFVIGVQFHPERTESTPPAFEALWRSFVDACRPHEDRG